MKTGVLIIINACIWGLVILGCSLALKGTGTYGNIQNILVGGSFSTMILIFLGTRKASKKQDGPGTDSSADKS